jgi:hypothetical protein
MILTLRASGRFAGSLNSRQEQRDQNADDRNDDEQFDQRKRVAISLARRRPRDERAHARGAR